METDTPTKTDRQMSFRISLRVCFMYFPYVLPAGTSVQHRRTCYPERPERLSGPLELVLQVFVSCHMGAGNETAANTFNSEQSLQAPKWVFF